MKRLIIEIKAESNNQDRIREILKLRKADFKGIDHQVDTYFNVNYGRLKLREGRIENSFIFYDRENKQGPKQSNVTLFEADPESPLKEILTKALGISVVIDKHREIYFIDNVKFHIDAVEELGTFIEIEAIDKDDSMSREKLLEQCQSFLELFQISQEDLISVSYRDLLLQKYIDTSS